MPAFGLRALAIALCLSLVPAAAMAREDYCINPNTGQIDQQATQAYRQFARTSSPQIMRQLAGTWLSTTQSPATNQVSYLWESFDTQGFYSYYNRVCTLQNTNCFDYQGIGEYAVRAQNNGRFFGTKIVSDLNLDHACLGLGGRFRNRNLFTSPDGSVLYRRVQ